jgi:glycosyltransferase involved in cell wall biosynthesis
MITLITPTVPERADQLAELSQSVSRQSCPPSAWLIGWDHKQSGPAVVRNRLANQSLTRWLMPVDDDDLLDPNHIETIEANLQGADIVYTWCRVTGGKIAYNQYQVVFDADWLREENFIPNVAAIRTELWESLGGQRTVEKEDWDFWRRAQDAGAHFVNVPKVTWTYRLGDWPHRSDGA